MVSALTIHKKRASVETASSAPNTGAQPRAVGDATNGLAILFPAWVTIGSVRARGIDAMKQRLLLMAGVVLAIVAALVTGAVAGGAAAVLLTRVDPQARSLPIVVPALIVSGAVIAECWLAVEWLGRMFERTDAGALDGAKSLDAPRRIPHAGSECNASISRPARLSADFAVSRSR